MRHDSDKHIESQLGIAFCKLLSFPSLLLMVFQGSLSAQNANHPPQSNSAKVKSLFHQGETEKVAKKAPLANSRNQPAELRVIDRETAKRIAAGHQQNGSVQPSQPYPSYLQQRSSQEGIERAHDQPASAASSLAYNDVLNQSVRQVSYQHGEARIYQTPVPNPSPYDIAPGYGPPYRHPTATPPVYSAPLNAAPGSRGQYEQVIVDPRMELLDDRQGLPSGEHPGFNSRYPGDGSNMATSRSNGGTILPQSNYLQAEILPQGSVGISAPVQDQFYDSGGYLIEPPSKSGGNSQGNGQGYGQGYLQNGANFQGNRLQNRPFSATERALELQAENERSGELIRRLQGELEVRAREWDASQAALQRKEEELRLAMDRIHELRDQLYQATQERNLAVQERTNIERQFNDQLKGIETMLDGVLLEQLSDK